MLARYAYRRGQEEVDYDSDELRAFRTYAAFAGRDDDIAHYLRQMRPAISRLDATIIDYDIAR